MSLNPFRRAYERGRRDAIEHLRGSAELHRDRVGDARRRSALNAAADRIRDGREPSR